MSNVTYRSDVRLLSQLSLLLSLDYYLSTSTHSTAVLLSAEGMGVF